MSHPPSDPLAAVDALLAAVDDGHVLPAPVERVRLREAAGLTQAAVAQALGVRVPSIQAWEEGRAEPKADASRPTGASSKASPSATPPRSRPRRPSRPPHRPPRRS
ncbi:helix-turn-helix domain-containing protein [Streptomyces sp. NPDC058128]|uniref:helix-turn-helix domain-containing protein n=1 Tax=Streptomyces sp. NPDC058128 TaxID=3346352 RepID=UPI0036EA6D1A